MCFAPTQQQNSSVMSDTGDAGGRPRPCAFRCCTWSLGRCDGRGAGVMSVHLPVVEQWAGAALAGPKSRDVLAKLFPDLDVDNEIISLSV